MGCLQPENPPTHCLHPKNLGQPDQHHLLMVSVICVCVWVRYRIHIIFLHFYCLTCLLYAYRPECQTVFICIKATSRNYISLNIITTTVRSRRHFVFCSLSQKTFHLDKLTCKDVLGQKSGQQFNSKCTDTGCSRAASP